MSEKGTFQPPRVAVKPWYASSQLWMGLILLMVAVLDFKLIQMLGKELDVTIALSGLALLGFRLKTSSGIQGIHDRAALVFLPLAGCALLFATSGCATSLDKVYEARMIYRVDSAKVFHFKKRLRGITIEGPRVGEVNTGSATLGFDDTDIFAGTFPLSATDAWLYQQLDEMGASAAGVNAGGGGGTRVRIDGQKYLGTESSNSEPDAARGPPE